MMFCDENYNVCVLFEGYSQMNKDGTVMKANCTCTLIKGPINIIVDTMTAWDKDRIIEALKHHDINPEDVNYVVSTHGHSDHIGNNNLFLNAKHIVGQSISHRDTYFNDCFQNGATYTINNNVDIIPTPGHTMSDVSVLVKTSNGNYAIAGDLFENGDDIENPNLWMDAGSESPELQRKNRFLLAKLSHWIIPGHGPMFKCTKEIQNLLELQNK